MLGKTEVNGDKAEPVFEWLKATAPGLLGMKRVKWNFEKFLVGKDGVGLTFFFFSFHVLKTGINFLLWDALTCLIDCQGTVGEFDQAGGVGGAGYGGVEGGRGEGGALRM